MDLELTAQEIDQLGLDPEEAAAMQTRARFFRKAVFHLVEIMLDELAIRCEMLDIGRESDRRGALDFSECPDEVEEMAQICFSAYVVMTSFQARIEAPKMPRLARALMKRSLPPGCWAELRALPKAPPSTKIDPMEPAR